MHREEFRSGGGIRDGGLWVVEQRNLVAVSELRDLADPGETWGESRNEVPIILLGSQVNTGRGMSCCRRCRT